MAHPKGETEAAQDKEWDHGHHGDLHRAQGGGPTIDSHASFCREDDDAKHCQEKGTRVAGWFHLDVSYLYFKFSFLYYLSSFRRVTNLIRH